MRIRSRSLRSKGQRGKGLAVPGPLPAAGKKRTVDERARRSAITTGNQEFVSAMLPDLNLALKFIQMNTALSRRG